MKKYTFTLYGALIGLVCAALGSAFFALFLTIVSFRGPDIFTATLSDMLATFVFATLFLAMFAAFPGVFGDLHLARWLARKKGKFVPPNSLT
jgi:CDP-diglyceride synthetase